MDRSIVDFDNIAPFLANEDAAITAVTPDPIIDIEPSGINSTSTSSHVSAVGILDKEEGPRIVDIIETAGSDGNRDALCRVYCDQYQQYATEWHEYVEREREWWEGKRSCK